MNLELISFALCPFAQRTIITLRHKQVDFTLTSIDLKSPPDWFAAASPLGKVPILRVDGERTIFESAVISELVDELYPPRMLSPDPLARAWERGWIAHVSTLLGGLYRLGRAEDEAAYALASEKLCDALAPMERQLELGPLFGGGDLSLLDAAIAPFFTRLAIIDARVPVGRWRDHAQMAAWAEALLGLPVVQGSAAPTFRDDYLRMLGGHAGHLASSL